MHMASKKLLAVFLLLGLIASTANGQLSESFYAANCPQGPAKVAEVVQSWVMKDIWLAPSLLRLHFHDCFVRGCDASVLLDSMNGVPGEKEGLGNKGSLRGFEVIDDIKAKVEALCPGVVSCADILALAARDAIVAMGGGPGANWSVPLGRRDGVQSLESEANTDLPPPFADYNTLVSMFAKKGLSATDMVVLSGSHTVGRAQCAVMQSRLYNFSSLVSTDPSLDPVFAASLKKQCKQGDFTTKIKMDQSKSVDTWDYNYFSNVLRGKGLFQSDDATKRSSAGLKVVQNMNRVGSTFNRDFGAAMVKMGQAGILTGTQGQIRKKCNLVNK